MPSRALRRCCIRVPFRLLLACLGACALTPTDALAQRELHWDAIEVTAHLESSGALQITETQTMVLTGDWNGGERRFNIRPRQRLSFDGMSRGGPAGWQALVEDSSLDDVDDYAFTDPQTLRWRSRRASDAPFAATTLQYQLRYALSGILLKNDDRYTLDHDFAFSDRVGAINRFAVRLTFDPEWRPLSDVRPLYTAGPLLPGTSFVLTIPFRYEGTGVPAALDTTRAREIVAGVAALLVVTGLAVAWFFVRERSIGRFAPLYTAIDEPWLRDHILKHPAEVVAAAWDEGIGTAEVVALIARMVGEGTLKSKVDDGTGKKAAMTLRLNVERSKLQGIERALVDGLFFDGRTETSTSAVREHYRAKGFNPAELIERELKAAVDAMLLTSQRPPRSKVLNLLLFVVGLGLVLFGWFQGYPGEFLLQAAMLAMVIAGWLAGVRFRADLELGRRAALKSLLPAFAIAIGTAAYLWFRVGSGAVELAPMTTYGLVAVALSSALSAINALKSRRNRGGIAFRKMLAAGRAFFITELRQEQPALRDEWYPWLLAFELGKQMDDWSAPRTVPDSNDARMSVRTTTVDTTAWSSGSNSDGWTGFAGGRSGGAGAAVS